MFRYPVTADEIYQFMDNAITTASLHTELNSLLAEGKIFQLGEYFSLRNEPALAERRTQGNERATGLLRTANRIGKSLYKFPFVRGVGISGSLSKNYAEADADIDFFIITDRNHLWIARTFLHGLKKLSFMVGKQHWYCMNYFIDEDALVIAEKNIFTATEVVTLKPVCGETTLELFYKANHWAMGYFPNLASILFAEQERKVPVVKKVLEKLFNNRFGNYIDDSLMRITAKRWAAKERKHKLNSKGNPLGLIAGKHFARPNPEHFQRTIIGRLSGRLDTLGIAHFEKEKPFHFFRKEMI